MKDAKVTFRIALGAVVGLGLAACQNDEPLGRDFGDSVSRNMAIQTVNPAPSDAGKEAPDMSGLRAQGTVNRYETGKVIDTKSMSTTTSLEQKSQGQGQK